MLAFLNFKQHPAAPLRVSQLISENIYSSQILTLSPRSRRSPPLRVDSASLETLIFITDSIQPQPTLTCSDIALLGPLPTDSTSRSSFSRRFVNPWPGEAQFQVQGWIPGCLTSPCSRSLRVRNNSGPYLATPNRRRWYVLPRIEQKANS